MKRAQAVLSKWANKFRRVGTLLKVGDEVWLDAQNYSLTHPSKQPDWKRMKLYGVTEVISLWA
jgi:hypothetical protein